MRHVMLLRGRDANIVGSDLHQVHRDDIAARRLKMVVELLAFQKLGAVANAVTGRAVLRQNHRQFGTPRRGSLLRVRRFHCCQGERSHQTSLHKLPPRRSFFHEISFSS